MKLIKLNHKIYNLTKRQRRLITPQMKLGSYKSLLIKSFEVNYFLYEKI